MNTVKETTKSRIRLSHTYRHLKVEHLRQNLYLWLLILPVLILFMFNYSSLTYMISNLVKSTLSLVIPSSNMIIQSSQFLPYFGNVSFIDLPTAPYNNQLNYITLFISIIMLAFVFTGRRKGHPVSIFVSIGLFVQIISSLFFLFASNDFPYTATIYSELYIKQQVSLWLFFFIILGVLTALLGNGYFLYNIFFLTGIMIYSLVYGVLRYLTYLYILSEVSTIYMAALFFTFGPLFDFLYVTFFYGRYVSRIISVNETKESEDIWEW